MTLILGILSPHGLWQSADHRLVTFPGLRPMRTESMKFLGVKCTDAWLMLSYTGIGRLGGSDTGEWLVNELRNRGGSLEGGLSAIAEAATSHLGPHVRGKLAHVFVGGAFQEEKARFVRIANVPPNQSFDPTQASGTFDAEIQEVDDGFYYVEGQRKSVVGNDWVRLEEVCSRKPRSTRDFMHLLAAINRRAAMRNPFRRVISTTCTTSFMPPSGLPMEQTDYWWGAIPKRATVITPLLVDGVDVAHLQEAVMKQAASLWGPDATDADQAEAVKRVLDAAVESGWLTIAPEDESSQ